MKLNKWTQRQASDSGVGPVSVNKRTERPARGLTGPFSPIHDGGCLDYQEKAPGGRFDTDTQLTPGHAPRHPRVLKRPLSVITEGVIGKRKRAGWRMAAL